MHFNKPLFRQPGNGHGASYAAVDDTTTALSYAPAKQAPSSSKYATIPSSPEVRERTSTTAWSGILNFGWWWEIGGVLLGIACTCLTIGVLSVMNGRALATWKLPIQPNSVVAVFSAIARSALLVPIAECLSQLKWIYFDNSQPRALSQLQAFDDASRGPWGSMVLFWKTRQAAPPVLALIGAGLTILMLAFEPFAQQVVEFPTRDAALKNSTGWVTATTSFPASLANSTLAQSEGECPAFLQSVRPLLVAPGHLNAAKTGIQPV